MGTVLLVVLVAGAGSEAGDCTSRGCSFQMVMRMTMD